MSELTLCNYCSLQSMKKRAKKEGKKIKLSTTRAGDMAGWIKVEEDGKAIAYFMKLSSRCVC
uniref:Uncharacterized protein n=1 Tax=viral metagenome TaxID=1070528 RepID=A0A6M3JPA6_9ZZZZ